MSPRRVGPVATAALLFAVLGGVAEAAAGPVVTKKTFERVGSRRVKIAGGLVPEQAPVARSGEFIAPNENAHRFAAVLRGKARSGGVLAVGSFRGLHDAAFALEGTRRVPSGFHTILVDVDGTTTAFNLANIATLAQAGAGGRAVYVYALHGLAPRPGTSVAPSLLDASLATSPWTPARGQLSAYLAQIERHPEHAHTVFGSERLFRRVSALTRAGNVTALSASVTDPGTSAALGRALRKGGARLSVIDVSNVPEWLVSTNRETGGHGLPAPVYNLDALPLSEDAVVLLTGRPSTLPFRGYAAGEWGWHYFAVAPADSATAKRKGYVRDDAHAQPAWEAFLAHAARVSPAAPEGANVPARGFARGLPEWRPPVTTPSR